MSEQDKQVANALAEWINTTPLPPTDIHPVYNAHVLLCSLIEQPSLTPADLIALRELASEMQSAVGDYGVGLGFRIDVDVVAIWIKRLDTLITGLSCPTCGGACVYQGQHPK